MKCKPAIVILFVISALYDGILGLTFLFAAPSLYAWFQVPPPNHFGYIHFPAAILITFAIMFVEIARNPLQNRNLIPFGILLKVSYCGVVFYYWLSTDLPNMWKPFAIADLIFLILFIWAYRLIPAKQLASE